MSLKIEYVQDVPNEIFPGFLLAPAVPKFPTVFPVLIADGPGLAKSQLSPPPSARGRGRRGQVDVDLVDNVLVLAEAGLGLLHQVDIVVVVIVVVVIVVEMFAIDAIYCVKSAPS